MKRFLILFTVLVTVLLTAGCSRGSKTESSSADDWRNNPYQYEKSSSSGSSTESSKAASGTAAEEIENVAPNTVMDADLFAKRVYELNTFFGVTSFKTPADISITALTYYSFCHMYYPSLLDMPDGKLVYRKTEVGKINQEVRKNFLIDNFDVTKSDLYNTKGYMEMWQPKFKGSPVYKASVNELSKDKYELTVHFYALTDTAKKSPLTKAVAVIVKKGQYYVFSSLSTATL